MAEDDREFSAREASEKYAPAPVMSFLLYGSVAAVLAAMTLWVIARFYDVNFLLSPVLFGVALAVAFGSGIVLRLVRMRRHRKAYRSEYDSRGTGR